MRLPCSFRHQGNVAILSHKMHAQLFVIRLLERLFEIDAGLVPQNVLNMAEKEVKSAICALIGVNLYDPDVRNRYSQKTESFRAMACQSAFNRDPLSARKRDPVSVA